MLSSDNPNKRALFALRQVEGNDICVDCGQKGTCIYISLSLPSAS